MAKIAFKGHPVETAGELPKVGSAAPDFQVVKTDLSEVSLKDFAGKRLILNVLQSIDTSICATQVRRFNEAASKLDNTVVLCVSMDLPFAHARFCGAEGLKDVLPASDFRHGSFGRNYGVRMLSGPLAGLLARSLVVVDEKGKVAYSEQIEDTVNEPNYEAALAVLKK
ncbi:MAG: thiol peroxidase [Candidatus Latescibacterota bacterium]|nr:MAG: thiol peroxidase [Candidatus Latescibacterota bacterium]